MEKDKEKKEYPKDSAGEKMINNVPICSSSSKVDEVRQNIISKASELETINYVYVVDNKKLVGVFSLKEVFRRKKDEKISSFMDKEIVKIRPHSDQEKAAFLAIKHNLKSIPVTSKDNDFLGIIPSDIIMNILHEEHVEDVFLSAGLHKGNDFSGKIIDASVMSLAKIKIPWLIVGLFGGLLAAQVTTLFEAPLKAHFLLAAFIPLILYMSGAVCSQTQALFIRNLSNGNFSQKKYLLKEIKSAFLVALALVFLLSTVVIILSGSFLITFILSVSLFLTVLATVFLSIFVSQSLFKMGKDPALGSGPFGTIIADISSLLIYFTVATLLLKYLG
jgi:magnesium transporter